ncbi:hypothetical protein ACFYOG_35675 [Streptomyces sp. NPDC007818]|uniref:hypothetical protein n=1 Tax=Streptomyces sp. NPDC007818 TaxID=3364780 RepID=UPI0036767911
MSYGYGGGPNWPMIQARRRAEEDAARARSAAAAGRATAGRWQEAFETLAGAVRAAAERGGAEHREGGRCGCVACWDAVIAGLAADAEARTQTAGDAGTFTFSLDDLFNGGSQQRP